MTATMKWHPKVIEAFKMIALREMMLEQQEHRVHKELYQKV
jgi:hypothetical protein